MPLLLFIRLVTFSLYQIVCFELLYIFKKIGRNVDSEIFYKFIYSNSNSLICKLVVTSTYDWDEHLLLADLWTSANEGWGKGMEVLIQYLGVLYKFKVILSSVLHARTRGRSKTSHYSVSRPEKLKYFFQLLAYFKEKNMLLFFFFWCCLFALFSSLSL